MKKVKDIILKLYIAVKHHERGATAVEYGIMVALIAAVIIGAVAAIGTNLDTVFQGVADTLVAPE